jgi:hypothetical protein
MFKLSGTCGGGVKCRICGVRLLAVFRRPVTCGIGLYNGMTSHLDVIEDENDCRTALRRPFICYVGTDIHD